MLDPQGKVVHQALNGMGFDNVKEIRQGKYFVIDIDEIFFSQIFFSDSQSETLFVKISDFSQIVL